MTKASNKAHSFPEGLPRNFFSLVFMVSCSSFFFSESMVLQHSSLKKCSTASHCSMRWHKSAPRDSHQAGQWSIILCWGRPHSSWMACSRWSRFELLFTYQLNWRSMSSKSNPLFRWNAFTAFLKARFNRWQMQPARCTFGACIWTY